MAGEGDAERLVVLLEARLKDFENNFKKARQSSKRDMKAIEDSANSLDARLGKLGAGLKNFGKGILAGMAAGGIAGVIDQIGRVVSGIASIGDEAKRAGLSNKAFQELKFVAEQNRIGIDSLVDGIKEMNLRADEFIRTGAGSAAEAFGRLGYDATTLSEKLKDPSALFTEIIGKLEKLDRAAQIRIADEVFGGSGGEQFVQLIDKGERGIRDQIRAANDLGAVMSDEVIARADELDRRFKAVTTTVSTGLKTAVVEVAAALAAFIDEYQSWAAKYEERQNAAEAGADIGRLANTPPRRTPLTPAAPAATPAAAVPDVPSADELSTKYLRDYRTELALTNRERAVAAETQAILTDAAGKGITVTKEQAEALAREKVAREEADAAGKKSTSERERLASATAAERERVTELIAELQEELSLVDASDAAKRAAAVARQAGAAATAQEREEIIRLNEAIYQGEQAREEQQEAQEAQKAAIEDVGNTAVQGVMQLTAAIDTGNAALDQLLAKLIEVMLQAALLGSGPLGGIFGGGLLGGAILPGILHDGGVAGAAGYGHGRSFSPGIWAGAPRMHGGGIAGLKPDEVPAILRRGEPVDPGDGSVFRKMFGGGSDPIRIELMTDEAFMAGVADKRIRTAAGQIIDVSVKTAARVVRKNMPAMLDDTRKRDM